MAMPREVMQFEATQVDASAEASQPRSGFAPTSSRRIDHFTIERELGAGGMGAVYLAHDTSLDRKVAIKVLPAELASSTEAQERFIREARAQARLASPHVVHIHFIGRVPETSPNDRGSLYFAMELVDGESLDAVLERGQTLDPEVARRFMIEVASGLRDAHAAGIIHRDIKPGNLLISGQGKIKIADFGLAKPKEARLNLTRGGKVMGTPLYMPPEQAVGEPVDLRADMYALGCTFYHLLAGTAPFDAPNPVALMVKHAKEPALPLHERRPEVPVRLSAVVEKLMRKFRTERYASYDELIADLDAAAPERVEYAGFWARGAAAAIDAAIGSLLAPIGWIGLAAYLGYITVGHAFFGQTLGKYLLRVQVQRLDGSRIGLARSLGRTIAAFWFPFLVGLLILWYSGIAGLSGSVEQLSRIQSARAIIVPFIVGNAMLALLYAAGMLLAAAHRQKRSVHDLLLGTKVVYRMRLAPTKA
jgi:uncharacterized RDD family membrane protein YckC